MTTFFHALAILAAAFILIVWMYIAALALAWLAEFVVGWLQDWREQRRRRWWRDET